MHSSQWLHNKPVEHNVMVNYVHRPIPTCSKALVEDIARLKLPYPPTGHQLLGDIWSPSH